MLAHIPALCWYAHPVPSRHRRHVASSLSSRQHLHLITANQNAADADTAVVSATVAGEVVRYAAGGVFVKGVSNTGGFSAFEPLPAAVASTHTSGMMGARLASPQGSFLQADFMIFATGYHKKYTWVQQGRRVCVWGPYQHTLCQGFLPAWLCLPTLASFGFTHQPPRQYQRVSPMFVITNLLMAPHACTYVRDLSFPPGHRAPTSLGLTSPILL